MDTLTEILVCLPIVAAFLILLWPERTYEHTPLDQRREPTIDRHKAMQLAQQLEREL